ncbi:MAG: outer membrane lipoprotein-sorting protein [Bacteroidia bacterium]
MGIRPGGAPVLENRTDTQGRSWAVVWGKVVIFVSGRKNTSQLRSEYYDEDGFMINVMQGKDIREMGGRTLPTRMEMIPVEEPNKTILSYKSIEFDKEISDSFFTIQNMKEVLK